MVYNLQTIVYSLIFYDYLYLRKYAIMNYQSNKWRFYMYQFDPAKACQETINWLKEFFQENGPTCNAIVGISGGKDSSITAALLVKALGRERVIGVLMPNGEQSDIDKAHLLCQTLGIKKYVINIKKAFDGIVEELKQQMDVSEQTIINLPPRLRMSTLYAVGQSHNGRVANTCNLSEDYVGYSTRYGDSVGDFSPLSSFTVTEVKQMGHYLGLPNELVEKIPSDGLSGLSDEDKLGFTYEELDRFIREGQEPSKEKLAKIQKLHQQNLFKLELMPSFKYRG